MIQVMALRTMSTLQTSMRSITGLCKQNIRQGFLRPGCATIFPRNCTGKYQSHIGQLPSRVTSCRKKQVPDFQGIAYKNTQPLMSFSRNFQTSKSHQLRYIPERRSHTTSKSGIIGGSEGKGGDFRDTLDALVAESIKEEDLGPMNSDEMDDEDEIFISQSGKMLLFPWRLVNTSREGCSDEEREVIRKDKTKVPSVTAILQKTMSPDSAAALLRWERFMIKKMGLPAFQKLKKEMFSEGHQLHANIGHILLNKPEEVVIEKGIEGFWKSIKERLPELASDSPIIECHTRHPYLGYHGYADCVTEYRGKPCLVEFKTSRKPKKSLSKCFDNPMQVAAYLGALNFDPKYQFQINQALLVITYKDGSPADLHVMTPELCDLYWNKWLKRLQEYREMEGRKTAEQL
ncbi:mitochondrial genome maintenance exonuclease 1 [Strongylocentrotus purpuratus]|uniref:Mitochondrial genome maintenance exonuclease 1 n=1 Tax=Strongylocentrotus purpuratus TaxID=7668 RepID=A0A7M7RC25_STRPU|nr:mitochondrial genome maintenance exonuclease 1 [Strongylocentrotus purpuratus]